MKSEQAKKQAALAEEAKRRGIPEWMAEMAQAVPDSVVREIVRDHQRKQPSSMAMPATEAVPRTGLVEPPPLETRSAYELTALVPMGEEFAKRLERAIERSREGQKLIEHSPSSAQAIAR
jgi:hypothetical protein